MVSQRLSHWDWIVTSTDEHWEMCLEDIYLAPTYLEWPKTDLRMPRYVLEHNCGCSCGSFCQKSGKMKQIGVILNAFSSVFVPISYKTDQNQRNPKTDQNWSRNRLWGCQFVAWFYVAPGTKRKKGAPHVYWAAENQKKVSTEQGRSHFAKCLLVIGRY